MVDLTQSLTNALKAVFSNKEIKFQNSKDGVEKCIIYIDNKATIKGQASNEYLFMFSGTLYFYTNKSCQLNIGYFLMNTRYNSAFSDVETIELYKDDIFKVSIEVENFHFDSKMINPMSNTKITGIV